MAEKTPAQHSVTDISPKVARACAVAAPIIAVVAVLVDGSHGGQVVILAGLATLVLVAAGALIAYVLTSGQFPRKLTKEGVELPPEDVEDTGQSLDLVQKTVVELAERIERIERRVGSKE